MHVIMQQIDLDTCLSALILGVTPSDHLEFRHGEASERELADPSIICIEAGGSGRIDCNNFDHHGTLSLLDPACVQALRSSQQQDERVIRLVTYVAAIETGDSRSIVPPPSVSWLFSGIRLVECQPRQQFYCGIELLKWVLSESIDPFSPLTVPTRLMPYHQAKLRNASRLARDLTQVKTVSACNGKTVGFLESRSIGGTSRLLEQFNLVILYHPAFGCPPRPKFTIASRETDVLRLVGEFDSIEPGWGGRSNIIGSPRSGSTLSPQCVIEHVINLLEETA